MSKSLIYIIVAGIIVVLFGSSAYLLGQNKKSIEKQSSVQNTPFPTVLISPTLSPASPSASLGGPTATEAASFPNLPPQDVSSKYPEILKKVQ